MLQDTRVFCIIPLVTLWAVSYTHLGRKRLSSLSSRPCLERPDWFLVTGKETLVRLREDLEYAMKLNIDKERQEFGSVVTKLDALSPLKILSRGYSVTRTVPGLRVVKDYRHVSPGGRVFINLHKRCV